MAVKETVLVTSTAAAASGGTYVIQNSTYTTNEPTAEESRKANLKNKQQNTEEQQTKETEKYDPLIVETVSDVFEGVSQYRFATSNATQNKVLIPWNEIDTWVKKVDDNVTNKEVWPNDLIFRSNRSSQNYARQLRQKCYQAADYLSRVSFDDNKSRIPKEDLFKTVENKFNNTFLTTLCSKDNETYPETSKNKFLNSTWTTLNLYLNGNSSYTFPESIPEENKEAKDFYEEKKSDLADAKVEEIIKKYTVYVIKQSGQPDKFASKENFGIVFNKLEEIPFLKGVLIPKQ